MTLIEQLDAALATGDFELIVEFFTDNAPAIRAALELAEESQWRTIEAAPKDGTWVLLSGGGIEYGWDGDTIPIAVVGQYTDYLNGSTTEPHWQFAWYDGGYYGKYSEPTHWKPLPEPPSAVGGKE